ncbi:hypothetical protein D6D22_07825 [Aureobasidium pullulans]|uniref:Uncharacterized protein n=1 Tax=Aureobasidium pullulans TaxID=5580 RepID=A0A4S8ZFK7_AURPU|nr:hypothetical protein D6D22_07825 [Aureobasidium pullulans]THW64595.1 hypothetical protein D6D20_02799 [Aureobasidium pullulans]
MTLFCHQPSRLLRRLVAANSQGAAASLLQHNIARHALNGRVQSRMSSKAVADAPIQVLYPRRLQIFHSPTLETAMVGTSKLGGLGLSMLACLVVAPNVALDQSNPIWMAPAVVTISAAVLPLLHLLTRPFVTNIFIDAPAWARRSKESLVSWARQLPPDTAMEIETLGLLPWPRTKVLRVSELRLRTEGYGRLANLEQVTAVDKTSKVPKPMRWSLQRFYARPVESRWKKSRAPEVWPLVFEAISRNTVGAMSKGKASTPVGAVRPVRPSMPVVRRKMPPPSPTPTPTGRQNVRKR